MTEKETPLPMQSMVATHGTPVTAFLQGPSYLNAPVQALL